MKLRIKLRGVAALFVLANTAHAQSFLTLYGAIDNGLLYQSTSASSFSPKAPNNGAIWQDKDAGLYASYWGLKGIEDIGGGYVVNFKLQGAFSSSSGKFQLSDTTGVTAIFNQVAAIGISGPFGTVDVGRQYAPMIYAMVDTDVRAGEYFGSILTAWLSINQAAGWSGANSNLPIGALFDSNALVYQSPKFYGASFALEYAPGGVAGQVQGGTRESAVIRYSNYGLNVSAVYYNGHDTNPTSTGVPTGLGNNRFYYLGAMYRYRGMSVSASYSVGKNPSNSTHVDIEMISGGLGYQFTPWLSVTSGYYHLRDRNNSANHSCEYSVGASYFLSKRTTAYLQVGYVDNKGAMSQWIAYGAPVAPGVSTTAAMIGVRHSF
ncbi:porin [Paraburkholderia hospita]|jgi:predicted porin|uniref:porin n=1 Tax=Paraburkholderia hospita TaxID=169430 RepID=UPI001A98F63B|nr:porin [Paraburkholderia hospita]